jgi:hypothetical protein
MFTEKYEHYWIGSLDATHDGFVEAIAGRKYEADLASPGIDEGGG